MLGRIFRQILNGLGNKEIINQNVSFRCRWWFKVLNVLSYSYWRWGEVIWNSPEREDGTDYMHVYQTGHIFFLFNHFGYLIYLVFFG